MSLEQDNQKVLKIVNPDRIDRILGRVFEAHLDVLMRSTQNQSVAVRGKAHLFNLEAATPCLVISDVSEQGHRYLAFESELRVEFVGMSTQIIFQARKLSSNGRSITVARPSQLMSYDRRENVRVQIGARNASFFRLGVWSAHNEDPVSPPVVPMFEDLSSYLLLADMSEGGVCGITRFPGIVDAVERGVKDEAAVLILPMHEPINIPIEVRWTRRIKESKIVNEETRYQRHYRIGIQFRSLTEAQRLLIKQYMQQLTVSEAI